MVENAPNEEIYRLFTGGFPFIFITIFLLLFRVFCRKKNENQKIEKTKKKIGGKTFPTIYLSGGSGGEKIFFPQNVLKCCKIVYS